MRVDCTEAFFWEKGIDPATDTGVGFGPGASFQRLFRSPAKVFGQTSDLKTSNLDVVGGKLLSQRQRATDYTPRNAIREVGGSVFLCVFTVLLV